MMRLVMPHLEDHWEESDEEMRLYWRPHGAPSSYSCTGRPSNVAARPIVDNSDAVSSHVSSCDTGTRDSGYFRHHTSQPPRIPRAVPTYYSPPPPLPIPRYGYGLELPAHAAPPPHVPPPFVYVHPSPPSPPTVPPIYNDIHEHDVLCGRGAPSNWHPGNQYFRALVSKYQAAYLASRRADKPEIATKIVDMIRNRGGRFLKRTKVQGIGPSGHFCWEEIGEQRAYEKACQALREGAPDIRRRLSIPSDSRSNSIASGSRGRDQGAHDDRDDF